MLTVAVLAATPSAQAAQRVRVVPVPCSTPALIAAIVSANTVPATLQLTPSCTYPLTQQLPQITGTVRLFGGPSTTLTAGTNSGFRVLDVATTGHLRVHGITIKNAIAAFLTQGGGIQNAGDLVLENVTLTGNNVSGGVGGGLANVAGGRALVVRSLFSGNNSPLGRGGGISNAGVLTVVESRVTGNIVQDSGGGIANLAGGTLHVVQTTVDHNTAAADGGGILNEGTATVSRSLVARNGAAHGGGVFGPVTIDRSTVRNNIPDNCDPVSPAC